MNPQYWYIANIDTKELSYENFGVLGDWFYNKHVELFRSICLPCLPSAYDSWCANYTTQPSALFTLPPEVFDLIFAQLRLLPDVLALAITCRYLLGVGKKQVLRATRAFHAPWAGCRLICFGTYMRPDDMPERMLKDGDGGATEDELLGDDEENAGERERAVSFPDVACGDYRLVFGWVWALARANHAQRLLGAIEEEGREPSPDTRGGEHAQARRARGVSKRDYELFSALYGSDHCAAAYPSGTRVLCNLSKGEYIREDALPISRGAYMGMHIGWGHVLLARICWSSSPESGMPATAGEGNERLCRGPWAGDRVCITSLDVLPQAEGGRAWRDVSAEVEEVLSSIWKTEPGKKRDLSPNTNLKFQPWEICCSRGGPEVV
ncbi:hypothetical protein LXA43DRAFT_939489 [Ganoderma leucocontextum]|nr:hypothetical protein LXA43DRAFT_939489 [Ganoderma leucocontextum]